MDKRFKKMFDEATRCLNWDVIMGFYDTHDYESAFNSRKRGHGNVTREHIKKELKTLVEFVIVNNIGRFEADQWIILTKTEGDMGAMIEVIFAPTKGCAFENEIEYPTEEEVTTDDYEISVLQDLLKKSVSEENYELSAVLRDRMNRLRKPTKSAKLSK